MRDETEAAGAAGTADVRRFGAAGDGETLDTAAIQAAVDGVSEGGGRVVLPPGTYLSGTLVLKSGVFLDLQPGAVLQGSPRIEDYPEVGREGHLDMRRRHLIYAEDARDCGIVGQGTIDGNGPAFWEPERSHEWAFWITRVDRPSPMLQFVNCRDLRIEGVTIRNSPGWTVHTLGCEHVRITGITIRNGFFGPNNDGLDIDGCRYVVVSDCDIETGDDAVVLKTTFLGGPTEYVTVSNCVLSTSCSAFKLGSESHFDFRHISLSNCVVPRSPRFVTIKTCDGGNIEDVFVGNMRGTTNSGWPVNRPIEIMAGVRKRIRPNTPAPAGAGRISGVTLRDIDAVTDGRIFVMAEPGSVCERITLANVRLRYAMIEDPSPLSPEGWLGDNAEAAAAPAAMVADNISELRVECFDVVWPEFPMREEWHVLHTENRLANEGFYANRSADEFIRGDHAVPFHVLWGRRLRKGCFMMDNVAGYKGADAEFMIPE